MSEMKLLKTIQTFLKQNPGYEPTLVELSGAIYILSCKTMGEKPHMKLSAMTRGQCKDTQTTHKHNPRQ